MYMSICKPAEDSGVYVLHGCRRVWHEDKQPAFKAIYTAFQKVWIVLDFGHAFYKSD